MSYPNGKKNNLIRAICFGVFLVTAVLFAFNRQMILDQISVWEYHPTAEVSALIDDAGMNSSGKFIFYASQPTLEATNNVNSVCETSESTTSILGCYRDFKIYISNVTNSQLDGIRQVTAAHETLHGIYERLSDSEKQKVNKMVEEEYKKLTNNQEFADLIAYYSKAEPGQRDNELHSLIGTEISNLSPDLEAYYSKYFSNRQKVVGLNTKYSGVFKSLENQRNQLATQLNNLQVGITARSSQYNNDAQTLNSDIASFNARAENSGFSSMLQFNNERSQLSSRVVQLEVTRQSINGDISTYETLRQQYNSIVSQSNNLYDSIKTTLTPTQSL